jgi:hypothetical protein
VITEEYVDPLVRDAREYLTQNGVEIPPGEWGGSEPAAVRLFALGNMDAVQF